MQQQPHEPVNLFNTSSSEPVAAGDKKSMEEFMDKVYKTPAIYINTFSIMEVGPNIRIDFSDVYEANDCRVMSNRFAVAIDKESSLLLANLLMNAHKKPDA